jgi:tetratricopeptide (TPR) repeat protein
MLGLLLAATLMVQQEPVRITASLSVERVSAGEVVVYRVSVETDGAVAELTMPSFPRGLNVLRTQDFTETQLAFPGGRRRVLRREVVLLSVESGVHRIPAALATLDGRRYESSPLTVVVVQADGLIPTGRIAEPRFLVRLDPATVYVGQEVLLEAEARFPEGHRSRRTRPPHFEAPAPPGFWIQELAQTVSTSARVEAGQVQEVMRYRRALFPLTEGDFVMAPAVLTLETRAQVFGAPSTQRMTSDSLRLTVLPLPEAGRPAGFAGAVGRFEIDARLESERINTGDAVVLLAEVRGRGHIKALPAPQLPQLAGIEVVSRTEDSELVPGDGPISGVKRFRWVLAADAPGTILLSGIEYPYFDPETRSYAVARSQPLQLEIGGAPLQRPSTNADTTIMELRQRPAGERLAWTRSPLFRAAQALPLALLALAFGWNLWTRRARRHVPVHHDPRDLVGIEGLPDDVVLGRLHEALDDLLRAAGAAPDDAADDGRLRARLHDAGFGTQAAAEISATWFAVLASRYAPGRSAGAIEELVARTRRVLRMRPAPGPTQARGTSARSALIVAALLLLPLHAADARGMPSPDGHFAEAVAAYSAGRYTDAVRGFQAYLDEHRGDADGWYNLGNAYLRSGDRGRAAWAWSRALLLQPRHADAQRNLDAIGARQLAAQARVAGPLHGRELEVLATLALWLAAAVGLIAMRRRQRGMLLATGSMLLLAVALGGTAWWMARHLDATVVVVDEVTPLLAGPAFRADIIESLAATVTGEVVEQRGDWTLVRIRGREGWVDSRAIARLR